MAEEMKQGDTLNVQDENLEQEDVETEDDEKFSKKDIIKYAAIGGAVLIIAISALVVYSKVKGNISIGESTEDSYVDDTGVDLFDEVMADIWDEETIESLRNAGYTGYEIEEAEQNGEDPQAMLEEAVAAQEAEAKKYISDLVNDTPKLKALYNQTFLGNDSLGEISPLGEDEYEEFYSEVKNLDYVKIGGYGNQLWIKLRYRKQWLFMAVEPSRYAELRDKGNMVLSIDYVKHDGKIIVTGMSENNVEDGGNDFYDTTAGEY